MAVFFITGINGLIGSHLTKMISDRGHRVIGLVRPSSNLQRLKSCSNELVTGCLEEINSFSQALAGVDTIIHSAGCVSDWGCLNQFLETNTQATIQLIKLAEQKEIKKFIYISSTTVHGFGKINMNEQTPFTEKTNAYSRSKQLTEQWIQDYIRLNQPCINIQIVRPGNVFGPQDTLFTKPYLEMLKKGKMALINGGNAKTCPTYIENLMTAIWKIINLPLPNGETWIITDGLDITWQEFTAKLATALGVAPPKLSIPFKPLYALAWLWEMLYLLLRKKNPPLLTRYRILNGGKHYHFSIEKANKILKFTPPIDLQTAIKQSIAWFNNLNEQENQSQ
jgi:nucleoside-diphosphate-sugar epimerase